MHTHTHTALSKYVQHPHDECFSSWRTILYQLEQIRGAHADGSNLHEHKHTLTCITAVSPTTSHHTSTSMLTTHTAHIHVQCISNVLEWNSRVRIVYTWHGSWVLVSPTQRMCSCHVTPMHRVPRCKRALAHTFLTTCMAALRLINAMTTEFPKASSSRQQD